MREQARLVQLFNLTKQRERRQAVRTMSYVIVLIVLATSQPAQLIQSAFRLFELAMRAALGQ